MRVAVRSACGEADIGALGKQRIVLEARRPARPRRARRHRRRRTSRAGCPCRPPPAAAGAGSPMRHRQACPRPASGISAPVRAGRAHRHGHPAVRQQRPRAAGARRPRARAARWPFVDQQPRDAAGGVAAGAGLAAVGVEEAHAGVGVRSAGSITMSWSQPIPRWRSAIAPPAPALSAIGARRASSTTKSLPSRASSRTRSPWARR